MAKISVADLNMTVPDGFTLHMAVVAAKPENKFCRNVVIAKEQVLPGTTVDQYKQAQLKMLSQSSAGFSTVKSGTVPIGGENCPMIETESVGPGGLPLASIIAYVKKGDLIYTFTATNTKGAAYAAAREEFIGIFKSVALGK
jgi:hypothetical protein